MEQIRILGYYGSYLDEQFREIADNFNKLMKSMVGSIKYFARSTPPDGWLEANGALLLRSAYPDLWTEAQASGNLVSEATWTAGNYGSYSTGDGSTTFRIPDLRAEFIRAWDNGRGIDTGRALGGWQIDAIRNITGTVGTKANAGLLHNAYGAFVGGGDTGYIATGPTSSGYLETLSFDASKVVPTASENHPRNVALLVCIKY